MIAYYQKFVNTTNGDCWRTCIASILEIPQLEVPNFVTEGDDDYWMVAYKWLDKRDIRIAHTTQFKEAKEKSDYAFMIASGPSKSFPGFKHCVIVDLKNQIVHDPNPANKRLDEIECYEYFRQTKYWDGTERE